MAVARRYIGWHRCEPHPCVYQAISKSFTWDRSTHRRSCFYLHVDLKEKTSSTIIIAALFTVVAPPTSLGRLIL